MKISIFILILIVQYIFCCSNYLVTKGASDNGQTIISYAADSAALYGALYFFPKGSHKEGEMIEIVDWDSKVYVGKIPQVSYTYNVVGNMNEHSVTVTETTFGGRSELKGTGIIDYGNLIWITLQRSKTAREAIKVMGELVEKYGYYSSGESFSIGDPNEIWVLEMIGKGKDDKGAVWVARKIPDGMITAHANQARIRTFPLNDPDNCVYSKDVITFARDKGYYKGADKDFSFSDVYDPVTFGGARFCEGRVWQFFKKLNDGMDKYLDYAQGYNLTNRMPLFIKPNKKISTKDVIMYMRDHFENTWLSMTVDVGAEPFSNGIRFRPMTWKDSKGVDYLHERAVGTQQTAFNLVSEMRENIPFGSRMWFGMDDTTGSVHFPSYGCMTRIPDSFKDVPGGILKFSFNSMFWLTNLVTNFAYNRFDQIMPEVIKKATEMEASFFEEAEEIEKKALEIYKKSPEEAIKLITDFSVVSGEKLSTEWLNFFMYLFPKYVDGYTKSKGTGPVPHIESPGYSQSWLDLIVEKTGDHYKVKGDTQLNEYNTKLGKIKGV